MTHAEAFAKVHATILECYQLGSAQGKEPPTARQCWALFDEELTRLCMSMVNGARVPEAAIAGLALASISLLAVGEATRSGAEQAVAPTVDRLCELAGGKPR